MRETADELEASIRAACDEGDHAAAADALLRGYGGEILGFLIARVGDESEASEAYSDFAVDLWRGLERFEWRCSARAWAYRLARNAAYRRHQVNQRRHRQSVPIAEIDELPRRTPTDTPSFLRTPMVDRVRELRDELRPEERELLVLRVDRRLSWPEIAVVLSGAELGDDELERHAARLRQRFVKTKERLRGLAKRAGLFAPRG